ncbi:MAG: hypothetical protein H6977_18005 [Gammaproteobacteria bacterium]|nr:hypothetical protein [Gammaproteobacteria bacterium]
MQDTNDPIGDQSARAARACRSAAPPATPAARGSAALATVLADDPARAEVWAEFDHDAGAIAAARELRERFELSRESTPVLTGDTLDDFDYQRVLGQDPQHVRRVLRASHLVFGAAGGVVGLCAALVVQQGETVSAAAPGYPLLLPALGILFGVFAGVLLAGLRALRPRRDFVLAWIRDAVLQQGHAFVIVRTHDRVQRQRAREVLDSRALRLLP